MLADSYQKKGIVDKMKKWEMFTVQAVFALIFAAVLIIWAIQAREPIEIEQVIRVGADDVEANIDTFFLIPLIAGYVALGYGVAGIFAACEIYRLEKRLEESD